MTCMELFGPGLCRIAHKNFFRMIFPIFTAMWNWVVTQLTDAMEGTLLARFTITTADGPPVHKFVFLSKRLGNPRKLIWTRVEHDGDGGDLPLRLELDVHALGQQHLTGHALAFQCLLRDGGCHRITVAQMMYDDDSLTIVTARCVVPDSNQELWVQRKPKAKAKKTATAATAAFSLDLLDGLSARKSPTQVDADDRDRGRDADDGTADPAGAVGAVDPANDEGPEDEPDNLLAEYEAECVNASESDPDPPSASEAEEDAEPALVTGVPVSGGGAAPSVGRKMSAAALERQEAKQRAGALVCVCVCVCACACACVCVCWGGRFAESIWAWS